MTKARSMKIAIITGGQLHEREVSLRSANRVATQLRRFGHELKSLELDRNLIDSLRDFEPDVVLSLIHI